MRNATPTRRSLKMLPDGERMTDADRPAPHIGEQPASPEEWVIPNDPIPIPVPWIESGRFSSGSPRGLVESRQANGSGASHD